MGKIVELVILPPLAIGRLGSAATPMDNYTLDVGPDVDAADPNPLGYRKLTPLPTLVVGEDGAIADVRTPEKLAFKQDDRIRPVAPFLEVFARLEGADTLTPLTTDVLRDCGFTVANLKWSVCVANRKVVRRTGDERDEVIAVVADIGDHAVHRLEGRCAHFRKPESDFIALGEVRFIRPTPQHAEIRLRFTPAGGHIYGPPDHQQPPADPAAVDRHYVLDPGRDVYDAGRGHWKGFDNAGAKSFVNETLPPALYSIELAGADWLNHNIAVSRGYFDDACDGFVEVRLGDGELGLVAIARIVAAPPAMAPDSLFVRNLADDLDQAILGPQLRDQDPQITRANALDIVRRAFETVRFMNVAVMNGNAYNGRPALLLDSMPEEEAADTQRALRPVMAPTSVDTFAIMMLHQQAYAAMRGGAAPWFARLLRRPDEVADFTDVGRRKMPALMCGADNNYLALTWRQIDTIKRAAATGPLPFASAAAKEPDARPELKPRNRTAQIRYAAAGNPINTLPVTAVANCCPGLEVDFRAAWRRLFKGVELREYDNLVVGLWPAPPTRPHAAVSAEMAAGFGVQESYVELTSADGARVLADLKHCRLLRVWLGREPHQSIRMMTKMRGPASSDVDGMIDLTTSDNPAGVAALEWSNALSRVLHWANERRARGEAPVVRCDFTRDPSPDQQVWLDDDADVSQFVSFDLEVRPLFEADTAVVSRALARAGELTQGLCSPWQNDYRECSCYYWASARPDFVNVTTDSAGLSAGDNWMSRERSRAYIVDDYTDKRLMMYDELFRDWEQKLKFEVGGQDVDDAAGGAGS